MPERVVEEEEDDEEGEEGGEEEEEEEEETLQQKVASGTHLQENALHVGAARGDPPPTVKVLAQQPGHVVRRRTRRLRPLRFRRADFLAQRRLKERRLRTCHGAGRRSCRVDCCGVTREGSRGAACRAAQLFNLLRATLLLVQQLANRLVYRCW